MQVLNTGQQVYDAVIVGSGATGGWVAKTLSEAGMKIALLEAGPNVTEADFTEHLQPYDLKYRGDSPEIARNRPIQSMKAACREANYKWFVDDILNPYTHPEGRPYQWTRGRQLGGRTLVWGRQSYRFSPMDFKPASRDGYGEDWPISYEDVVPYYERVERYVGISGESLGLPQLPDSVMLPPMELNCGEGHFKQTIESKFGRTVTIGRVAVLTRDHNGRAACHYCGPCDHGCVTHSVFSSLWTTLVDAANSGNCDIVTDAVVSHVVTDRNTGLASGVGYIDRNTRAAREIRAKTVVLCASALESARILLNSGEGFCNSSGALGRYVMDHVAAGLSGTTPSKEPNRWVGAPRRPNGFYIPRFLNLDRRETEGALRGFGYQGNRRSDYGNLGVIARMPGFGADFKRRVRESETGMLNLTAFGECLPRYENFVALDPHVKDAWGIPALHINTTWSDNEMRLFHISLDYGEEMLRAAGATNITKTPEPRWPGGTTHEIGSARMGSDPKRSVLNGWCQAHDVKNLFVTDGAAFVSSACQNPTLTMMALSVRAAEYMLDQAKRGELG